MPMVAERTRAKRKRGTTRDNRSPTRRIVDAYIAGVLNGSVIAGELLKLAVKRHVSDLQEGHTRGLSFNEAKAERIIAFFSYLKHSKGEWAGRPFALEAWQVFLLWVLFGWQKADGTRRFRTAYTECARKNGKSTVAAGIGLFLAFADGEMGAETYSVATKHDQALIVHSEATRMVKATETLRRTIQVFRNNLSRSDTYQKYEPLGADEDTMDGLNVHGAIVDELHAHKNRGVYDVIDTATGARRQPMIFGITTAGTDQTDTSICWEQHVYAEQILRGTIQDDTFFALIFAIDEQDDWKQEKNWYKANPNLGISKKLDYMQRQAKKAESMPGFLNTFLRLELDRWTQQVTRWIDIGQWDAQAGPEISESALAGRICYGGLDLSSVSDVTAWVLLFPDPVGDGLTVLCRLWCPESRLQINEDVETGRRRNRYAEQYRAWARDGFLLTTPGNAIDYEVIKAQIVADSQAFALREMGIDRLFQGYQLAMQLQEDHGITVAACGMGYMSMAGPCAEFERRMLGRHIRHGGHPVMRWMANNVAVREDPVGNKKPDKSSSQGKIDGIIGILLALDRVMRQQTAPASVYETRGMLTI